ncbi:MAG: DMT family transporter [Anaerolineales bacterium]|nr:DMT family transporter [Anaerolineales bacterium]
MSAISPPTTKLPPHLVLFVGILAVSSSALLIRYAQREAPSLVIAAFRMGFSALILLPLTLPRHAPELRRLTRVELGLAALGGGLLALHFASWILSLEYTSVASSVVLVTTNPLWVALLAPLFLKERLTPAVLLGMLVALGGGLLVGLSSSGNLSAGSQPLLGNFLALVGAWTGAGYILIGRRLRPVLPLTPYIFLVYGMAALVLAAMLAFSGLPVSGFSNGTYMYMLLLALLPQLLGHSSFNWALAHLPASFVSIALLGEPVGAIVLAFFLLGETPGLLELLGGGLILAGIFIATVQPSAKKTG